MSATVNSGLNAGEGGRLKVLYYGPPLLRIGATNVMIAVVNALVARGHEVHILVEDRGDAAIASELGAGVVVHHTRLWRGGVWHGPLRRLAWRANRLAALAGLLRRESFDVAIVDITESIRQFLGLRSLMRLRLPVVMRVGLLAATRAEGERLPSLEHRRMRRDVARADAVVVPSRTAREELVAIGCADAEKIVVIPNEVDGGRIRELAREEAPLEGNAAFCSVGALIPRKAFDLLYRAVARLKQDAAVEPELLRTWIVGEGNARRELEELGRTLDVPEVRLVGRLDNPWAAIARCRCFVATSLQDGFMLALAEAAMLGVPVIYPDRGVGVADELRALGIGRSFERGNVESLAAAMKAELLAPSTITAEQRDALDAMFGPAGFRARYVGLVERVAVSRAAVHAAASGDGLPDRPAPQAQRS